MSWQLHLGDCMSFMRGMDSSSIDVTISDPPYDKKTHSGMRTTDGGLVQLGFDELSTMAHVKELLRVTKRWVLCFCALEQLGEYQLFAGEAYVRGGFWDKINGMPQLTGDRPAQPGEAVAIMYAGGGRKQWNGGGSPALWRVPRATEGNHPTEKPTALMEMLVRQFTNYGDTIFDPYCGSGSTGVAAVRLGRNFIGVEMLTKYHQVAKTRLEGTHEQMDLTYAPKKKSRQLKLTEAPDVKEESEEGSTVGAMEEARPVPGDLLGVGGDQADAHRQGEEGSERQPSGTFPELADRAREEGDPFDSQEEDDGQGLGEAQVIGDTEGSCGEDFTSEDPDSERNAGW